MQSIVLATDGSDSANRALDFAAQLAQSSGAALWITHVADDKSLSSQEIRQFSRSERVSSGEIVDTLVNRMLAQARARAAAKGVRDIHLEPRLGDPAERIMELADEKHADAIVVGKRGTSTLRGLLLGSISQKLVSLAPCPVIVVP